MTQNRIELVDNDQPIIDEQVENEIVAKRYYQPNETQRSDMAERIADYVASAEDVWDRTGQQRNLWADKFFDAVEAQLLVPSSPIMFNAGTPTKMLSACTGVTFADDSIEAIMKAVTECATLTADGAGVGFDITPLRYRDAPLSRKGVASGACSWLKLMDAVGQTIRQGGRNRRAAMLAALHVNHPDVVEFCHIKDDTTKLTHMNISVKVTDEFMRKVEDKAWHTFEFPVGSGKLVKLPVEPKDMDSKDDPRWQVFRDGWEAGLVKADIIYGGQKEPLEMRVEAVRADWLMGLITRHAHGTGEPGLIFIDEQDYQNPLDSVAPITTTNPCVPADTWTMTADGPRQVGELLLEPFTMVVDGSKYRSTAFWPTGRKELFRVTTERGYSFRATPNHKVLVDNGFSGMGWRQEWKTVGSLEPGDRLVLQRHKDLEWDGEGSFEEGWLVGSVLGDGTFNQRVARLTYWGNTRSEAVLYAQSTVEALTGFAPNLQQGATVGDNAKVSIESQALGRRVAHWLTYEDKSIKPSVERASSEFYSGFLRGFFDADGSVQGDTQKGRSIRLTQSDIARLEVVQRMLSRLGVFSTIYQERKPEGVKSMPDGQGGLRDYEVKATHELVISRTNMAVFARRVGFGDVAKAAKLADALDSGTRALYIDAGLDCVETIELDGCEEVFDCTVKGVHSFDANGLTVHNCGEIGLNKLTGPQMGLAETDVNGISISAHDSCNLAHLPLPRFLRRVEATEPGSICHYEIDWNKLSWYVGVGVRFLDNVIELSEYRPNKIGRANRSIRKVGLGVLGWADMLTMLGIRYGSEESIKLAHDVMSFIEYHALKESMLLAKSRGRFALYDSSKYATHGLTFRRFVERQNMSKSHYVSPAWAALGDAIGEHGLRNCMVTMIAPTGSTALIVGNMSNSIEPVFFLEQRRRTVDAVEVVQRHWLYDEFLQGRLPSNVKREHFVEAFEVTPEEHVAMQVAFQQWTSLAISKTINLPHTASVNDVERAYMQAWLGGAKGITVYRDGSRGYQPVSNANVEMNEDGTLLLPDETIDKPGPTLTPSDPDVLNIEMTFRAPTGTTVEETREAIGRAVSSVVEPYRNEFQLGVTPTNLDATRKVKADAFLAAARGVPVVRPNVVNARVHRVEFLGMKVYVTVSRDPKTRRVLEVFVNHGKAGSDAAAMMEAIGRLASVALKFGTPIEQVVKQLKEIGGETISFGNGRRFASLPDAVGQAIEDDLEMEADLLLGDVEFHEPSIAEILAMPDDKEEARPPRTVVMDDDIKVTRTFGKAVCPSCRKREYVKQSGCGICDACGYSQCS